MLWHMSNTVLLQAGPALVGVCSVSVAGLNVNEQPGVGGISRHRLAQEAGKSSFSETAAASDSAASCADSNAAVTAQEDELGAVGGHAAAHRPVHRLLLAHLVRSEAIPSLPPIRHPPQGHADASALGSAEHATLDRSARSYLGPADTMQRGRIMHEL